MNDPVNHPSHYTDGGIETLDFILAKKMDFLTGQVCKYISRAGKKDPAKEIEDLEKARFYLNRKIDLLKSRQKVDSTAQDFNIDIQNIVIGTSDSNVNLTRPV